jgi:hypothetical protein
MTRSIETWDRSSQRILVAGVELTRWMEMAVLHSLAGSEPRHPSLDTALLPCRHSMPKYSVLYFLILLELHQPVLRILHSALVSPGVSNLLASLGHIGRRRVVLGHTKNTPTLTIAEEPPPPQKKILLTYLSNLNFIISLIFYCKSQRQDSSVILVRCLTLFLRH